MGESLISSRGSGGSSDVNGNIIYTKNGTFVAPKAGNYLIEVMGGGGGGAGYRYPWGSTTGGAAEPGYQGFYNTGSVYLASGQSVSIVVGAGGLGNNANGPGRTGGTSAFGSYLSAIGGNAGLLNYYWDGNSDKAISNKIVPIPFLNGETRNGTMGTGGDGGNLPHFDNIYTSGKNGNSGFVTVRW